MSIVTNQSQGSANLDKTFGAMAERSTAALRVLEQIFAQIFGRAGSGYLGM